jgi:NADH-quinone oxidoreductase subunit M
MILSAVTFLPILCAILIALWPSEKTIKPFAIGLSIIEFLISLLILARFDSTSAALQLVERHAWIERFGITYFLGIDGLSIWLVLLTTFLTPIVLLGAWSAIENRVKGFLICIFVLQTAMIGTFLAFDAVFFYLFWELSLVPMYFLIGIWGGQRRIYATVKFFIFTMFGSVLMLLAIIYLMLMTQDTLGSMSASLLDFYRLRIPFVGGAFFTLQTLLFFAFALAFAIKVPVFPFHTWLPDAHVEAPTPGSVILAGVMLKMGTYGFMRWTIPLFPEASEYWSWLFISVGVIGIIYGALVAMVQPDIKKLVAYSSVSHMGYVLLGLFTLNQFGTTGALYQMLNHGISTGALFLLVGMIYERTHSREISKYGGLASVLPLFTIAFFVITLSSIAVPMTNGFVGEFLILLGTFKTSPIAAYFAVTGVVLGAVYMLWMFKRVFFGEKGELVRDEHHPLKDLNCREILVLAPLVLMVFWMGLFPNQFLDVSKASLDHFVKDRNNYELSIYEAAGGTAASPTDVKTTPAGESR